MLKRKNVNGSFDSVVLAKPHHVSEECNIRSFVPALPACTVLSHLPAEGTEWKPQSRLHYGIMLRRILELVVKGSVLVAL